MSPEPIKTPDSEKVVAAFLASVARLSKIDLPEVARLVDQVGRRIGRTGDISLFPHTTFPETRFIPTISAFALVPLDRHRQVESIPRYMPIVASISRYYCHNRLMRLMQICLGLVP